MNEIDYATLNTVLVYLSGPAGAVAWFVLVSNFVRNLREGGGMAKWPFWAVQVLMLVVSLAVPLSALVIVQNVPPDVIAGLQPYWALIAVVSVAYLYQQWHYLVTKPGKETG